MDHYGIISLMVNDGEWWWWINVNNGTWWVDVCSMHLSVCISLYHTIEFFRKSECISNFWIFEAWQGQEKLPPSWDRLLSLLAVGWTHIDLQLWHLFQDERDQVWCWGWRGDFIQPGEYEDPQEIIGMCKSTDLFDLSDLFDLFDLFCVFGNR